MITCISRNTTVRMDKCPCMFNCGLTFRNTSLSLPAEAASEYLQEDAMELYQRDHNILKEILYFFRKCRLHVQKYNVIHSVKSFRIPSYSGSYFSAFRPHSVSFRIRPKCGKVWTRITPNMDTFNALITKLPYHYLGFVAK